VLRLLIHADDFGMTGGVTRGILCAMEQGVVTATSAMVCDDEDLCRVKANCSGLAGRLGLHLQLTDGRPVLPVVEVPHLVDTEGQFARHREQIAGVDGDELLAEWRAQLERFLSLGLEPSHLDTHHSVHELPVVTDVYRQLAREIGLPVRGSESGLNQELKHSGLACADRYITLKGEKGPAVASIRRSLVVYKRLAPAAELSVEIGCHPAVIDADLAARSRYVEPRAAELALLCDPELRRMIGELGFELSSPATLS
jgi:chitin disaccharide deacetylase